MEFSLGAAVVPRLRGEQPVEICGKCRGSCPILLPNGSMWRCLEGLKALRITLTNNLELGRNSYLWNSGACSNPSKFLIAVPCFSDTQNSILHVDRSLSTPRVQP